MIEEVENTENIDEFKNKYLRLAADFENYKKRSVKDKEDSINNTKINMISSILDIDNDLSIALKHINDKQVRDNISLIFSKLEKFLISQGISTIQTNKYDSDIHEVINIIDIGEEKIIEVVSKGYSLYDKPFRYPKIILGK